VLINNHNYAGYLGQAIDSALAQDPRPAEIIVVDDGSTDASREVITAYGDRVKAIFKPNGGQGSAFNAAVAASRGDILCFLDADDRFRPGKLARIARAFQQNGLEENDLGREPMLVHHLLALMDADGRSLAEAPHGRLHVSPLNLCDFALRYRFIWNEAGPTSGLSINRLLAERLFPIPEEGVRICADDFVIGGASLVGELHCLPEIWADYRIHGTNNWYMERPRKTREFLQIFENYLNAKLIEEGRPPVISLRDSIYAWDLLLDEGRWASLLLHMVKLGLRQRDRYTMRFIYYTGMKAARSLKRSVKGRFRPAMRRDRSRRAPERISA
jgi:glycosyltransferase involved in cell wall biosynthesis